MITAAFVSWRLAQKEFVSVSDLEMTTLPAAGLFVLSPSAREKAGGMLLVFPSVRTCTITGLNSSGGPAARAVNPRYAAPIDTKTP
jgi:hypothetical protein